MKCFRFLLTLAGATLWLAGCQERLPVELVSDESAHVFDVRFVEKLDSKLIIDSSVDSTGLLYRDEQMFPATLLVNSVKSDLGGGRKKFSFSRILINDKRNPITDSGRVVGYLGLDVGKAKLNALNLPKIIRPYRTPSTLSILQNAGPSYALVEELDRVPVDPGIIPGQHYAFIADGRGAVKPFTVTIQGPDEITIIEPKALSIVPKDEDLQARWDGVAGESFKVVISLYNPNAIVVVQPLASMGVQRGKNSVTIPAKLLQALPLSSDNRYLFSFISLNQKKTQIPGYSESVLVQAASIHNLIFWLR
ncbi:MAG TPA: hypothetical protein DCP63_02535 [Bacteroidetes bacterium]|nr:hypothetical protein [Bacteroidota bacterium]